jgi:tRNA threonylcarbamoyl adenosine modification protein YeaZ
VDIPLVLALDTGSPCLSVALGRGGTPQAQRAVGAQRSAGQLMALIAELFAETGARPRDLGGVVALRGPGSFTGLRIGLATALGFHQALGVPALALSTLEALAASSLGELGSGHVLAAVDALRGEWAVELFASTTGDLRSRSAPTLVAAESLLRGSLPAPLAGLPADVELSGFGLAALAERSGGGRFPVHEPGALAPVALRLASLRPPEEWDAGQLTLPIYSRPPAVTLPRPALAERP